MTESTGSKEAQQQPHDEWLQVESLDLDAQGVAHKASGMVVFIEGALPFEEVQLKVQRRKNNWEQGTCLLYTSPSPRDRTRSRMPSSA